MRSQKYEKVDKNQMRNIKDEDKKQRFSLRFSPFFCPDLGEDQKK